MNEYDTAKPYTASYLILKRDGKIAFVMRTNTGWMNGYYSLPSGKVEKPENFSAAATRELLEEIGVSTKPESLKFVHAMHRYAEGEERNWIDVFFEVTEYEGEPFNAEPEIHSELAWLDPQDLPEKVIPYIKYALEQADLGNPYSEYDWENSGV